MKINKDPNYIQLVEKHVIKRSNSLYEELDHLCFLSKNLYNATLYNVRQHYFKTGSYLQYKEVNKQFTEDNNPDYRMLPAKVSKHVQMLIDRSYRSFFKLRKNPDFKDIAKPPHYLKKDGRQVVQYEKGALSLVTEGFVKFSKTNISIPTKVAKDCIQFARIVPCGNHIIVEIGYNTKVKKPQPNNRYASIDLGVNNLMAVSSNVMAPYIINGKPLKSVNQYYNKRMRLLKSDLSKIGRKSSNKMRTLSRKRTNKINDYLHKSSTYVVNQLVSNNIGTLIVGYNKGWKQDMNMSKVNNQNFQYIPFLKLVNMLEYKCKIAGIDFKIQEESYTSKCSFLDNETIRKKATYKGRRVHRGLYKSSKGLTINADVNGSLNILKKYLEKNVAWGVQEWKNCVVAGSMPVTKILIR